MHALAIVHQWDAGPGVFAEAAAARGLEMEQWRIAEDPAPPRPLEEYGAVLIFGGAMNVDQEERFPWLAAEKAALRGLLERGTPLLGACLGSQLLAEAAGSSPHRASHPEIGWHEIELTEEGRADPLFGTLPEPFVAFQWHSYTSPLPPGAVELARSPIGVQGYRVGERAWGLQFHAEVSRADAEHWIRDYRSDPDAIRIGIDPAELWAETEPRLEAWNELGRGLGGRFLDIAAEPAGERLKTST